jgi:hypothetical protein
MKKLTDFDALIERLKSTYNYGNSACRNQTAHDILVEVAANATLSKRQRNTLVEMYKLITNGSV